MMNSRTIGYQEKRAKHSTPPIRNAYAERLRRSLGASERGLLMRARPAPARRLAGRERGPAAAWLDQPPLLFARIWFTALVAPFSNCGIFAFGLVSTASMTGSSDL